MKYFLPLFFLIFSVQLVAQDDHYYGTCGNERSNKIFFDGHNRYLAGTSDAIYNAPAYIIKTDTLGNVIWSKGYSDMGNVMQIISVSQNKLMLLFDGPYTGSGLLTIDTAGNVLRYKGFQAGFRVYLLANYFNSVIVSGTDYNNTSQSQPPFLAVLDTASNWLYGKYYTLSNFSYNYITSIAVNTDSTIFCLGGGGLNQSSFFKVDPALNPGAVQSIDIQGQENYSIFTTPGNGYLIAGGYSGGNGLILTKVNASNTIIWQKEYVNSLTMTMPFACLSSNGSKVIFSSFLVRHHANNPLVRNSYAVIETDTSGILLFSGNYGDTAFEYFNEGLNNVAPSIITEGNHVVLQSYTTSNISVNAYISPNIQTDFQVVKLDNGFNSSLPSRTMPVTVSTNTSVPVLNYAATGYPLNMYLWTGNINVMNQIAVVSNSSECSGVSIPEIIKNDFTVYPNPTSGIFNIRTNTISAQPFDLKVYSSIGELVLEKENAGAEEAQLDISNKTPGLYFVEITCGNKIYRQKLEVVK
jgi:hypothetical protein